MIQNSVLRFGIKVILTAAAVIILPSGSSYSNPFNSPAPLGHYAELPSASDSIVYQNDSIFTIEGVKEELSGDGEWIRVTKAEIDPDGVKDGGGFDEEINTDYVWRPYNMDPGWSPYTNGYWRYSYSGWMWHSYYSWGWRPYHYGRWWWSDYYGWVWSPGFIFAPAWVVWIFNDDYYGWYPISPRVWYHHHHGYRCHNMRYRVRNWNFCEKRRFADPINPIVIVDPRYNPQIINTGTFSGNVGIVNDQVVNEGPSVKDIEKHTGIKQVAEDVSRYNNSREVKNILKTEDNTNRGNRTVDVKTKDAGTNDERKRNDDVRYEEKKTQDKRNQERKYEDKQNEQKRYEEKPRDEKRNEQNRNEKKREDEQRYEEKKQEKRQDEKRSEEKKKETYSPPKNDDDGNKESTPPNEKNDGEKKNHNDEKSNEGSKHNDGNKQDNSTKKNESNDNTGKSKGKR